MLTDLLPLLRPVRRASRWLADQACAFDNYVASWCELFGVDDEAHV